MLELLKNTAKVILTPFIIVLVAAIFIVCMALNLPLLLVGVIFEVSGVWDGLPFWMIWTENLFNIADAGFTKWKQL